MRPPWKAINQQMEKELLNKSEIRVVAERLYEFIHIHQPGCCRLVSAGPHCLCPLCDVDRLLGAINDSGQKA